LDCVLTGAQIDLEMAIAWRAFWMPDVLVVA
jgi:hypothetical protein